MRMIFCAGLGAVLAPLAMLLAATVSLLGGAPLAAASIGHFAGLDVVPVDCQALAQAYCARKCAPQRATASVLRDPSCVGLVPTIAASLQEAAAAGSDLAEGSVDCQCEYRLLTATSQHQLRGPGYQDFPVSKYIVPVFAAGMAGANCYRIPTVIRTAAGTLLAFAEQRMQGCGDNGENHLVLRRSFDDGHTWGPIIVAVRAKGESLSNANPVEVKTGSGTRILLHFDTQNNPTPARHGRNMQVWSHDEGLTWDTPEDISHFMPDESVGCMPGPSIGLQAIDGTIYFTCHGYGMQAFLYWSRDLGKTWSTSHAVKPLNECSIALLANQSIAMNCRTGPGGPRAQMTWGSGGERLTPLRFPENLKDPGCQGSLFSLDGALYLSNDNTVAKGDRSHLTIKESHDNGLSWGEGHLVWPGPSAYSQLVGWQDKAVPGRRVLGVMFEFGEAHRYEKIGFASWAVPATTRIFV